MAAGHIIAAVTKEIATNSGFRQFVMVLIMALIMPILLVVIIVSIIFTGGSKANRTLLDCSFDNADIPDSFTEEQVQAVEYMRESLTSIDEIISEKENTADYDVDMVKAVFYCLQFGTEPSEDDEEFDMDLFCDCFAGIPFSEIDCAYENISENFPNLEVTDNLKKGVEAIYNYLTGGDEE